MFSEAHPSLLVPSSFPLSISSSSGAHLCLRLFIVHRRYRHLLFLTLIENINLTEFTNLAFYFILLFVMLNMQLVYLFFG